MATVVGYNYNFSFGDPILFFSESLEKKLLSDLYMQLKMFKMAKINYPLITSLVPRPSCL